MNAPKKTVPMKVGILRLGNIAKVGLQAIARNKMRSLLTMLGIIIGVGCVITMLAVGTGASASIQATINSLGTNFIMLFPGAETQGGAQNRDQLPRIESDMRTLDRNYQQAQIGLSRGDCYDQFLFTKTFRNTPQCKDLARQVDVSKRRLSRVPAPSFLRECRAQPLLPSGAPSRFSELGSFCAFDVRA